MNEDFYDTGNAVVSLYRQFRNPQDWVDPLGRSDVLGITGPCTSYPSFVKLFQLKLLKITCGGTIPETRKKHLITLSAHNLKKKDSMKIILCSNCSMIYVLYSNI